MKSRNCVLLPLVLLLSLAAPAPAKATIWSDQPLPCPACGKTANFRVVASYGGYIYRWPSRCQFLFWPLTDGNVLYSCPHCRFTALMWDFRRELTPEKKAALGKALEQVTRRDSKDYAEIPMSERLAVAEKVYAVLGLDERGWSDFFRAAGYHLEVEGDAAGAATARRKALDHALKALADPANEAVRKELLVITGSMRAFLGEKAEASKDFARAVALQMLDKDGKPDSGRDGYLDGLIRDHEKALSAKAVSGPKGCEPVCAPECFKRPPPSEKPPAPTPDR